MLLVLAFAPIYRLMDASVEAPHRQVSVEVAGVMLQLAWWGTVVTVLLSWILGRLLPASAVRGLARASVGWLMKPPPSAYALALGAISTGLATLAGLQLYQSFFTNVDEIASTLHARYLARGMIAGPTFSVPEFWLIPNTLVVPEGWVSHFAPTHLMAMAALIRIGIPSLVGPLFLGGMTALVALSLLRLLPDRPASARAAALAVAICPFLVFLGGGSMSHVSAGAFGAAVLYSALRARDGNAWWSVPAGAAMGLMVSDRPLVGLVLGAVFTLGVWIPAVLSRGERGVAWLAPRAMGSLVGGVPFAVFFAWYNQRLFGSPFRLGYLAALGDRHRLGFHMDPWGYSYDLREAVAFTSSDVLTMGIQLLETPFPLTALIGLRLILGTSMSRGMGLLLAWAFVPLLANGYYWFHDVRMLFEAAPAWVTLGVLAAVDLAGATRDDDHQRARNWGRDMATWAVVVGLVGATLWGVPERWESYGWSPETLDRISAPSPPTGAASIVFVHTSWNERLSATLQGAGGMRQDSIITALRRNTNCGLHRYALARVARSVALPDIDLHQIPGTPVDIDRPQSPSGATFRVRRGEPFPEACRRELRADRFGAVALAPLLWQGDLPGIEEGRPLFVRDLGPESNQRLLDLYADRLAFAFLPTRVGEAPEIVPYAEAMRLLWGAPPDP